MRIRQAATLSLFPILLIATACGQEEAAMRGNLGGANRHVRLPGNVQGGLAIAEGEIAVHPDGATFFSVKGSRLYLGRADGSSMAPLDNVGVPERLAFLGNTQSFVALENGRLYAFDQATQHKAWETDSANAGRLDVSPDGKRVATANDRELRLHDVDTGLVLARLATTGPVRNVSFLKDGRILVITDAPPDGESAWGTAHVEVLNASTGESTCSSNIPNCAGRAELSNDENRAFMSPTVCNLDPVSVINLADGGCGLEKNLPGFGPVARSPDGNTMVAFLDNQAAAEEVPTSVKHSLTRYHLMFLDAATLDFTTMPIGQDLPRFAFTPDGSRLLVDLPMAPLAPVKIVEVSARTVRPLVGPPVKLNAFTFSPDSSRVFAVDKQLFQMDLGRGVIKAQAPGHPLTGINVSPLGNTLLLSRLSNPALLFLDAVSGDQRSTQAY